MPQNDWKFKTNIDPISTSEFWYDVFEGGYIKPSKLMDHGDEEIEAAIELLRDWRNRLENDDMIEYN